MHYTAEWRDWLGRATVGGQLVEVSICPSWHIISAGILFWLAGAKQDLIK